MDRFIAEIRLGGDGAFYDPQYFAVVAELKRVAGTADERSTVAHMQTISSLLVKRGWHGLPSTACAVHADMTRFRACEVLAAKAR